MALHQYTHEHEAENGEVYEYDIDYEISRYRPATREQPEEGGEVEIISIKENGIEVELSDEIIEKITEKIYYHTQDNEDEPDDYEDY